MRKPRKFVNGYNKETHRITVDKADEITLKMVKADVDMIVDEATGLKFWLKKSGIVEVYDDGWKVAIDL